MVSDPTVWHVLTICALVTYMHSPKSKKKKKIETQSQIKTVQGLATVRTPVVAVAVEAQVEAVRLAQAPLEVGEVVAVEDAVVVALVCKRRRSQNGTSLSLRSLLCSDLRLLLFADPKPRQHPRWLLNQLQPRNLHIWRL